MIPILRALSDPEFWRAIAGDVKEVAQLITRTGHKGTGTIHIKINVKSGEYLGHRTGHEGQGKRVAWSKTEDSLGHDS